MKISDRMVFPEDAEGWPEPSAEVAPLVGREAELKTVKDVVGANFNNRSSTDHAEHTFLVVANQVRTGKTRMGRETDRAVKELRLRDGRGVCCDPVYAYLKFSNGLAFNPAVDPKVSSATALGARIACAFVRGLKFADLRLEEVVGADIEVVLGKIIEARLRGLPDNTVVPVVLHFDEYGKYVDEMVAESVNKEVALRSFTKLLYSLGSAMCAPTAEALKSLHAAGRYFVVPVATGTSLRDARFEMSRYAQAHIPLPLLSFEDSVELAKAMLLTRGVDAETVEELVNHNHYFRAALSDAGGVPGFVEMLCEGAAEPAVRSSSLFSAYLDQKVLAYAPNDVAVPTSLKSTLVQLMLAGIPVPRNLKLDPHDEKVTVELLADRGFVHVAEKGGRLLLTLPVSLLRGMTFGFTGINPLIIFPCGPATKWTWQRFEEFVPSFVAARLAALRRVAALINLPSVTLGHVLKGAQPANAPELKLRLEIDDVNALVVPKDKQQLFPRKEGGTVTAEAASAALEKNTAVFMDTKAVRLAADSTKLVDSYFTVRVVEGTSPPSLLTVFLQTKHSKDTGESIKVSEMNASLGELKPLLAGFPNGHTFVLVYVTNRTVQKDVRASRQVLWVSCEELESFMGVFAGRGLLVSGR